MAHQAPSASPAISDLTCLQPALPEDAWAAAEELSSAEAADKAYTHLQALFTEADLDGSGALDASELTQVLKSFYHSEQRSRSTRVVRSEVDAVLHRFDTNRSGTLEFGEFVNMFCLADSFKFKMRLQVKLQVKARQAIEEISGKWEAAWYDREAEFTHERSQLQHHARELQSKLQIVTEKLAAYDSQLAQVQAERVLRPQDDARWATDLNEFSPQHLEAHSSSQSPTTSTRNNKTPRQGSLRRKKPPVFTEADLNENIPKSSHDCPLGQYPSAD
eukprot:TRINITY_DN30083_c0_g1_i3.p1 TRINITY_DN30083_c0_g1~~TRINITY_DN30083_c0_g1_i3.p1  ORF type:complete len:275 (-),score=65.79 TRINITY_DN30083_c0_g1_i3:141-965(-)